MKAEEKKTTELAEELWDSFSEYINDDLDSLQYVAGKNVIFRSQFLKALVQKDAELKEARDIIIDAEYIMSNRNEEDREGILYKMNEWIDKFNKQDKEE